MIGITGSSDINVLPPSRRSSPSSLVRISPTSFHYAARAVVVFRTHFSVFVDRRTVFYAVMWRREYLFFPPTEVTATKKELEAPSTFSPCPGFPSNEESYREARKLKDPRSADLDAFITKETPRVF